MEILIMQLNRWWRWWRKGAMERWRGKRWWWRRIYWIVGGGDHTRQLMVVMIGTFLRI